MNRLISIAAVLAIVTAGCADLSRGERAHVVGAYRSIAGGFNETISLELRDDGSYRLTHLFLGCVIDADGKFESWGGEDEGTWVLTKDRLALSVKKHGAESSPYFLPAYCDAFLVTDDGLLVSERTPAIPAASPTRLVLKKTPDWSLAPTR